LDAQVAERPAAEDTEPDACEINGLLLRVMWGVNSQAFRMFGNRVISGPFAGMIIPDRNPFWDDGNSGSKLLGTYEFELHPVIQHAIWRGPRSVINVGCAEGYYAIGLAQLMPHAVVHAFDTRATSLELCREYAEKNGVSERVATREGCTTPQQMRVIGAEWPRLYVMDCEGAEAELLDLERLASLAHSDIIVECHDFLIPGISSVIADRLSATHRVELIRPKLPDLEQFQFMRQFPTVMSVLMATEKRPMPSMWLACWANTKGISDG
jgi:hypothetical protein